MRQTLNGLLFITHQTDRFDYLQSVEIALKGGCRQIQLRMKDATTQDVLRTGLKAKKLCDQYHARLYVNDHVEIGKSIGAAGVHLGKSDMSATEARGLLGSDYVIGGTANSFDDIKRLQSEGVDYIGLGPFRFTGTKKNLSPILGWPGYQTILNQCREHQISLPILAIGGITMKDIPEILKTGFAGIALSSTILNAKDPIEETDRIIKQIKLYQK
jgi:thiamine-phosphate pyrophosphorylase